MRALDQFVTWSLLVLAVVLGLPCVFFGLVGVSGRLTDTSDAENRRLGLQLLSMAALIVGGNLIWFLRLGKLLAGRSHAEPGGRVQAVQRIEGDRHDGIREDNSRGAV